MRLIIFEGALLCVALVMCWWLGARATGAWLARASEHAGVTGPSPDSVRALAVKANLLFSAGVIVLAGGRAVSLRRGRDPIAVPLLLPAAVLACLLGLLLHHGTFELVSAGREGAHAAVVRVPSAASFAEGFLLGSIAAAAILAAPLDLAAVAARYRTLVGAAILVIFAALGLAGSGPSGSGTRINLGPVQPLEAVKPLFVAFVAAYLGARAAKLRWQRQRILGLRWPRPVLLVPAVLVLLGIFAGLYLVGDLGPVLVLAIVFLGMFYLVTRATGWVALALGVVTLLAAVVARWPGLVNVGRVATRLRMWRDPWWNGMTHGHQLGEGLWAIAAGGWWGQGMAQGSVPLIPAGKTDLMLATLIEQVGAAGLLGYLVLLAAVVVSGLHVASKSRTPERVLLACGASWLLVAQWAVIHAGTFGLLPLTGIVVPFLSAGRSSMIAFLAVAALLARLAEDGRVRVPYTKIDELHAGARAVAVVSAALLMVGLGSGVRVAVLERDEVSAMGIVTRLRDGTVVHRQNPRLLAMTAMLRRGSILDRNGEPIAVSQLAAAARRYPLGAAMGTLLGSHPSLVLLPPWALERALDPHFRGFGERTDGPTYRVVADGGTDARLPWPDLRQFAPLLDLARSERKARLEAMDADVKSRSVQLTIDARLQREVAGILKKRVARGRGRAAAAAVLDVDSGHVLARVQVPDYDPNDRRWQERMLEGEPRFLARFTGAYGEWPDKTGLRGMYQSGSIAKLFTALAAARRGWNVNGEGCAARAGIEFSCEKKDAEGPLFTRPGWPMPIHDHTGDLPHGRLDVTRALALSCNVFFAQLGLELGAEPFLALRQGGADVGYGSSQPFDAGAPGTRLLASTAFGQGAMVMNVLQAARLVAAIGRGGRYRRCPPTMDLGAVCSEATLVDDAFLVAPILAGMREAMTSGTGRALVVPPGVRAYGKTGTADVRGFVGEEPFGIAPARPAAPHSWFVTLIEPSSSPECELLTPGRIAIAVVVPRGGTGASTAGPAAMEIAAALRALGYFAGEQ